MDSFYGNFTAISKFILRKVYWFFKKKSQNLLKQNTYSKIGVVYEHRKFL